MTRPTIVCLAFDLEQYRVIPKIYLRTLLFCTAQRGVVIENMYIDLRLHDTRQIFSTWAYDGDKGLVRGSGIYVGKEGVSCNHQFLLSSNFGEFKFSPGEYELQVFASLVGSKRSLRLAKINIKLNEKNAALLEAREAGVCFDWEPSAKCYVSESIRHRSVV